MTPEPTSHTGDAHRNYAMEKMQASDPFILDARFPHLEQGMDRQESATLHNGSRFGDSELALEIQEFLAKHSYKRIYQTSVPENEMDEARKRREKLRVLRPEFERFHVGLRQTLQKLQRCRWRIRGATRAVISEYWDTNQSMELELQVLNKSLRTHKG